MVIIYVTAYVCIASKRPDFGCVLSKRSCTLIGQTLLAGIRAVAVSQK